MFVTLIHAFIRKPFSSRKSEEEEPLGGKGVGTRLELNLFIMKLD